MKNEIKDRNTEQNILDAAEVIFLEKGYSGTTTTEIAKRAGVNHAMLHYYYRTKENLFEIIFEKQVKNIANSFLSIVNDNKTFTEFVVEAIERHFDFIKQNPKTIIFIISEINNNSVSKELWNKYSQTIFKQVIINLKGKMEKEIAAKQIRDIDPVDFLLTVLSLNVFVFIALPLFKSANVFPNNEIVKFLDRRKKENIRIALLALKL